MLKGSGEGAKLFAHIQDSVQPKLLWRWSKRGWEMPGSGRGHECSLGRKCSLLWVVLIAYTVIQTY